MGLRKLIAVFTAVFGTVYGDTLILTENKYQTYVQEEEFMLAEGENVIGPVSLLPNALTDGLDVVGNNETVKSIIYEKVSKDWKENLLGKFITVEGEGRIIRGSVVSIDGKYITLNTKKGFVITTLPQFPSRISSPLRWEELFSPQITLKVNSPEAKNQIIKIRYPVEGVRWEVQYILKVRNGVKKLKGFVVIKNDSPVDFRNVDITVKGKGIKKEFKQVSLPPYTEKKVLFTKRELFSQSDLSELPEGKVFVYRNGVFEKTTSLHNLFK
ncbi:MAG: hypothetical protein GXN94_05310 [Aquificae bacterium]|nr:hypothetical protein [Aquificota bacterium]